MAGNQRTLKILDYLRQEIPSVERMKKKRKSQRRRRAVKESILPDNLLDRDMIEATGDGK